MGVRDAVDGRWAAPGPRSSPPCYTRCGPVAARTRPPPCASASARASPPSGKPPERTWTVTAAMTTAAVHITAEPRASLWVTIPLPEASPGTAITCGVMSAKEL
jgi:hypothetical protein